VVSGTRLEPVTPTVSLELSLAQTTDIESRAISVGLRMSLPIERQPLLTVRLLKARPGIHNSIECVDDPTTPYNKENEASN